MRYKQSYLIFNDSHIPFEDKACLDLIFGFIKKYRPSHIVILGDFVDFYSVSRFSKDPARADSLQDDLDKAVEYLTKLRKISQDAEIYYCEGNHEARLKKYLWTQASALNSLRDLRLEKLLRLEELGIKYLKDLQIGDLYLYHGSIVRKHAGYTAKAEYDKNGCSGMTGHSHRDSKYTHHNRAGHFVWFENYCTCGLDPEYIEGVPDWTQGFSVVTIKGNRPYVEQVACISGSYIYGGKVHHR